MIAVVVAGVVAVVSALLVGLAMARMSSVGAGLRQTRARERELRRACEELLTATDVDTVTAQVQGAVARLLPCGTTHGVTLVLGDGVLPASTVIMEETRNLPADIAARLPGHDLVLHCRLSVGERHVGRLYVAAGEKALVELQQAVPVLAGQAAGMIDHIGLNREIERRDGEAYFRTLVLNAADLILIVDDDGRVRYGNPPATDLLGPGELTGRPVQDLFVPEQRAAVLGAMRSGARVDTADGWTLLRPTGERVETEVSIRDLHHEPSIGGIVLTLRDVTERRRLQREHEERTRVDPLTGLGNRLLFEDAVERAVLAPTVTGVLLVDVDDFRTVNDVFGRQVGDELLRAVGARLLACLDGSRTVARLDGDVFGVLVEGVGDALDVDALVGHVVDEFTAPFVVLGSTVTVRLGIGVATTDDADDAPQLLGRAGEALRTAKSRGRGHWCRYEAALHQEIVERTRLRTELADAIAGDRLVLRYRPIVELGSGRPDGFESLAGWPHPVGLTGIAEEAGLVGPLGSWVLDRSIRDAVGWHHLFPDDPPHVSVRVSARQFRAPGFVEHVLTLINRHGLAPHLLTLAISGSLLLAEPDEVREDLSILRNAGLRISIDGFGAGNLSHLHRVPADVLKLDRSLVDTSRQYDLVAGIVRLARTLRLDVVAEDAGTATDRSLLHAIGCRYLIGHPMPADEVVPWLMAHLDLVPS